MFNPKLVNFCYSCIIDGSNDHKHINLEDAHYDLLAWLDEDPDMINSIGNPTPTEYRDCYNTILDSIAA